MTTSTTRLGKGRTLPGHCIAGIDRRLPTKDPKPPVRQALILHPRGTGLRRTSKESPGCRESSGGHLDQKKVIDARPKKKGLEKGRLPE